MFNVSSINVCSICTEQESFFEEGIKPMVVKKIMLKRRYNDDFTSIIYYIIGITTEQLKKTSQQNWVFATRNIRII